jgi:hypothetical protein
VLFEALVALPCRFVLAFIVDAQGGWVTLKTAHPEQTWIGLDLERTKAHALRDAAIYRALPNFI